MYQIKKTKKGHTTTASTSYNPFDRIVNKQGKSEILERVFANKVDAENYISGLLSNPSNIYDYTFEIERTKAK